MRKLFISRILQVMVFVAISISAHAQVTITKANMPVAGQNYIYTTSNDSIDVSQTGANQTWDFSTIKDASQDTFKYVTAAKASPLYALSFNGDAALDLKLANMKGAYSFFKTSATVYQQDGLGISIPNVPLPTAIPYSGKPDIWYHFPLNYTNIDSCVFGGSGSILSLITVYFGGKRVNTVDGWGTVKTPYKTYSCIRVKSVVTETDSIGGQAINNDRVEYKWLSTTEQIPVLKATVTTDSTGLRTYVLQYRDAYKNIVNPNAPVVDFNVADTNVFINTDSILFNNNTTKALTYAWTITPATYTFAAKTTRTSKNPQVIFNAEGFYTVSLTATGIGGSNTLTKIKYINATHNSGIKNISENTGISIYPNPTSGDVFLHFNGNLTAQKTQISVTNIFGQTVLNKSISTGQNDVQLNLNGFAAGVYFVKCQVGGESFVEKVVVK